jgi:hypothetical protein
LNNSKHYRIDLPGNCAYYYTVTRGIIMGTRLPVIGSDDGVWGDVLNTFLQVEHNTDGTLKRAAAIDAAAVDANVVHKTGTESVDGSKTFSSRMVINEPGAGVSTLTLSDTTSNAGITFGTDTNIFRSGNGQLQTSSAFFAVRATLGVVAIGVTTSGDTTRRFQINTDGKMLWSAGTGTQDTTLIRDTTGGLKLTATTGTAGTPATPGLSVVQNGVSSSSTSGGGTVLINNNTNPGSGLIVYSNAGSGSSGRLVNIRSNNAAFDQPGLHVDYAGTAAAVEILHTGTGSNGNALNIASTNQNDTAFGVGGYEISKGTIKVVHNYPGVSDANASALSLRANGSGTAAQGIFFDAEDGGTTGNLMKMRNAGVDQFIMAPNGGLYTKTNLQVGSTVQDFGAGAVVIGLKDATTVPTTNPTGGVIIYSEGSVLKYRNSAGSIFSLGGSGSDANPQPNDQAYKGWAYDPSIAANKNALTSGQPILIKIKAAASGTVNNINVNVDTPAASGFTASASFAALYDMAGNLLSQTSDLAILLGSTGAKALPLNSGVAVTAGTFYYVWMVVNATTPPSLNRGANIGVINQGTSPGTYRFCNLGSGISAAPATITLASSTAMSISYWAAIS